MTHTPFSLAFEQAERELGERIGYPALVYDQAEPLDDTQSLREQLANGNALRSRMHDTIARQRRDLANLRDAVDTALVLMEHGDTSAGRALLEQTMRGTR